MVPEMGIQLRFFSPLLVKLNGGFKEFFDEFLVEWC